MPAPACILSKHTCAAQQEAHHGDDCRPRRVRDSGADDGDVGHAGAGSGHEHRVGVEAGAVPQRDAAHHGGNDHRRRHAHGQGQRHEHRDGNGHHHPAAAYGEHRGAHQQERQRRHQRRRDSPADAVDEDVEQPQLPVGLAEHEAEAHHDGKGCHALGAVEEMLKELLHGHDLLRHIQQELGDDGQQRGQRYGLRHPAGLERVDDEKCQRRKGHDDLRHGAFSLPGKLSVV